MSDSVTSQMPKGGISSNTYIPVPDTNKFPSSNGYVHAKYLTPGDFIFDLKGEPQRIESIIHGKRPTKAYRVVLNDGSFLSCSLDTIMPLSVYQTGDVAKDSRRMLLRVSDIIPIINRKLPTIDTEFPDDREAVNLFVEPVCCVKRESDFDLGIPPFSYGVLYALSFSVYVMAKFNRYLVLPNNTDQPVVAQVEAELDTDRNTKLKTDSGRLDSMTGMWHLLKKEKPVLISSITSAAPTLAFNVDRQEPIPVGLLKASDYIRQAVLAGLFCDKRGDKYEAQRELRVPSVEHAERIKHLANSVGRFAVIAKADSQASPAPSTLPYVVKLDMSTYDVSQITGMRARKIVRVSREYDDDFYMTSIRLQGECQSYQASHGHVPVINAGVLQD